MNAAEEPNPVDRVILDVGQIVYPLSEGSEYDVTAQERIDELLGFNSYGMSPGHVFVLHGDLLALACDEVLVPTDLRLDVRPHWKRWVPSVEDRPRLLDSLRDCPGFSDSCP